VRGFDLVILDVSVQCRDAGKLLEGLKRYRDAHGPRPMTLCVSRVYRGPRFELDLEQQGPGSFMSRDADLRVIADRAEVALVELGDLERGPMFRILHRCGKTEDVDQGRRYGQSS